MGRLFLLSIGVVGSGAVFGIALGALIKEVTSIANPDWIEASILHIPFITIAGAGTITLGVMLAKHIIGLIKK